MGTLSSKSPFWLIEQSMPCLANKPQSSYPVHPLPPPEGCSSPQLGRWLVAANRRTMIVSSWIIVSPIAEPTTLLENKSSTAAIDGQASPIGMYVLPAGHPQAVSWPLSRLGATAKLYLLSVVAQRRRIVLMPSAA